MAKQAYDFTFVAFWSEPAWVVGTVTYNAVAQASDLKEAVARLEGALQSELLVAPNKNDPFHAHGDHSKAPLPEFALRGDEEQYADAFEVVDDGHERYACEPYKGHRYMGRIRIECPWDVQSLWRLTYGDGAGAIVRARSREDAERVLTHLSHPGEAVRCEPLSVDGEDEVLLIGVVPPKP